MLSYPNFVVSQVSTTDYWFFFGFKIEKSQTFCLKMTYTFSKKYEVTKKTMGATFRILAVFWKVVYLARMAPIGLKIQHDLFQTKVQKKYS